MGESGFNARHFQPFSHSHDPHLILRRIHGQSGNSMETKAPGHGDVSQNTRLILGDPHELSPNGTVFWKQPGLFGATHGWGGAGGSVLPHGGLRDSSVEWPHPGSPSRCRVHRDQPGANSTSASCCPTWIWCQTAALPASAVAGMCSRSPV